MFYSMPVCTEDQLLLRFFMIIDYVTDAVWSDEVYISNILRYFFIYKDYFIVIHLSAEKCTASFVLYLI